MFHLWFLLGFVILADYAFNEDSRFCVLPQSFKDLKHAIDTDGDGKISAEELKNAIRSTKKIKETKGSTKKPRSFYPF